MKANWPADKVERRPIDALIPYANNARTHSDEQVAQIAASMKEWGWTNPVLVDEDGMIIAGHGRVMAARKLGLGEVPVMVAEGWTEAQKKAYVIADNKLALNAGWDDEMLKVELKDLGDANFDLTMTGFGLDEMALLFDSGDIEPITTEPGESVGATGKNLVLGEYRIQLDDDEFNGLIGFLKDYAESRGTTMGFGSYLLERVTQ